MENEFGERGVADSSILGGADSRYEGGEVGRREVRIFVETATEELYHARETSVQAQRVDCEEGEGMNETIWKMTSAGSRNLSTRRFGMGDLCRGWLRV